MEQQMIGPGKEKRKTRLVSKKKGYYMDRPAIQRIWSVGPDYFERPKDEWLFPEDTEIVQEIVFRSGRNRVKAVMPEKETALSDYDLESMQIEEELAAKKMEENKYIKQLIRGSTETREFNYITKAIVKKRYEKIDMRHELGLYPYQVFIREIKNLVARLYG
jgi:hypothetical protein